MAGEIPPRPSIESFKYSTLPDQNVIRILKLYPGTWDDPIRCSLSTVNLDDETQHFEAISYAWGSASRPRVIMCNDAELMITKSLYDALQTFRPLRSNGAAARVLWADGICIDQGNTNEKNHQVKLMGAIYSGASKVLIWLGHDDSAMVQECLNVICRVAHVQLTNEYGPEKMTLDKDDENYELKVQYNWRDSYNSEDFIKRPACSVYDLNSLAKLRYLFACQWFERLWVVQELALSRMADLFWGNGSIDGRLIGLMAEHLSEPHSFSLALRGVSQRCVGLWTIKWSMKEEGRSLHEILRFTRLFEAKDPRDKVFGLTGLMLHLPGHSRDLIVEPNYELTKHDVYHQAVRNILSIDNDVDILAAVQHGREIDENWTSWVPDWTRQETNDFINRQWETSGDVQAFVSFPTCAVCSAKKQYHVSFMGIVVHVIQTLAVEGLTYASHSMTWERPERAKSLQGLANMYHGQYSKEVLASTMTGGSNIDHQLMEDQVAFIEMFDAFRTWDISKYEHEVGTYLDLYNESLAAEKAFRFFEVASAGVHGRRLFVTKTGMLGLGPAAVQEGDVVVVLFGGSVPFVLRPTADEQHYRFVGECYIHDIMDGQAVKKWQDSGEPAVDFHLF